MKGLKCINRKMMAGKIYLLRFSFLLLPIFLSLLYCSQASAINVNSANFIRAYYHSGLGYNVYNENYGSRTIPFSVLTYDAGATKALLGLMASTNVTDTSNAKYKTISVNFGLTQTGTAGFSNPFQPVQAILEVTANGTTSQGSCSQNLWSDSGTYGSSWTCNINYNNYETITAFSITLGSLTTGTNEITRTSSVAPFFYAVNVESLSYTISAFADPMIAGQNTIINQNETIINQNQTIINQDEGDREELENVKDEAQEDGENASEEAEEAGTTLFNAFSQLITALTGVHATNCNLVMPAVNMQGTNINLGTLDLCENEVPNSLKTLGSLTLVFLIVPMGINCAKRMLGLYNELLGGK